MTELLRIPSLVFREIGHRPWSFLLGVAWVALAVASCLILSSLHSAATKETKRVQRDIGFNLRIIPAAASVDQFLLTGTTPETISEEVAKRLASQETVAYNHLVATLHGTLDVAGNSFLLTGLSPTLFPPGHKKPPMSPTIPPGMAHIGSQVARRLDAKKGARITLGSTEVEIARVAPASGTQEDMRIWVPLQQAQEMLAKPGQINEIQAIDCLCLQPSDNPQAILEAEVKKVAPEVQVVMLQKLATARARQRQMTEKLAATVVPVIVLAGAGGLAVLAWLNVRQRCGEIALLQVLGHSRLFVAGLVLGKAVVWGIVGASVGSLVTLYLAPGWANSLFPVTGAKFAVDPEMVQLATATAPLITCLAAAIAATWASVQDPAIVLRED